MEFVQGKYIIIIQKKKSKQIKTLENGKKAKKFLQNNTVKGRHTVLPPLMSVHAHLAYALQPFARIFGSVISMTQLDPTG